MDNRFGRIYKCREKHAPESDKPNRADDLRRVPLFECCRYKPRFQTGENGILRTTVQVGRAGDFKLVSGLQQ